MSSHTYNQKRVPLPQVIIRTVVDGREEAISEYLCDWPDCPNVATEVMGVVRELRLRRALCAEHAAQSASGREGDARR
jgi:hypothetical protein